MRRRREKIRGKRRVDKGGGERNKDTEQGDGGKMHKWQKTGRKKTNGLKIHHGISGERESDACRLRRC